ncbi:MAG TPA: iron-containing alcohol dehydrogenase, partial [Candidatus Anaerobutyricum faecale]|nr:iron-containing alcohol dehydrogenase [Candidatus Anaerobutyricum faecale]
HSMAHKTGAAFSTGHIPHGCANAIYLPYVIKYNAKDPVAAARYAEIARRMGLDGTSQKALINSLCKKIDDFNVILGIPKTLKEFGINEEEFKSKVANISELAVGDACTGSNPREITPAEMERLFTCTYYGTEVDF